MTLVDLTILASNSNLEVHLLPWIIISLLISKDIPTDLK